jgi:hypothetical protein
VYIIEHKARQKLTRRKTMYEVTVIKESSSHADEYQCNVLENHKFETKREANKKKKELRANYQPYEISGNY